MANGIFTTKQQAQGVRQKLWTTTVAPLFVDALVIAGGGGSPGGTNAGGGGGGGFVNSIVPVITGSALTVTVGAGGTAGANGSNSVFRTTGASGGGTSNAIGGSGGGTSPTNSPYGPQIQGLFGQGNAGGPAQTNLSMGSEDSAGGGGGAGSTGSSGKADVRGGGGGYGAGSIITGTTTAYSGGGGGSMQNSGYSIGNGGAGGGGTGASGTANTGGGAGTAYANATNGGSGIVVVSYPDTFAAAASTTGSPTISTSGSGSILFNGSSQYLSTSATQVIPATGDFTIEARIYPTSFSGSPVFCGQGSGGDPGRTLFYITTGGVPTFTNGSSFTLASTGTVSLNTWTYIAFTRSGNTGTWYINGASAGTGSLSGITIQNTFVTIGGSNPLWTAQYFTGYISNFRISDAARTISSTPTAPFNPSTANTKMLLSTASGAFLADASTNAYTFTNNGTSTWNQLSPFTTGTGYKNRVYTWTSSGSITF